MPCIFGGIILLMTCVQSVSFDPRQIPLNERIAYVNRVADRAGPDNARQFYEAAELAFKGPWAVTSQPADFDKRRADQRVLDDQGFLMLADTWSDQETRVMRAWLDMNAKALEALTAATDRPTHFDPLVSETNRIYDGGAAPSYCASMRQCAKLLALKANEVALNNNWPDAYRWNRRVYRMADHLYQQPVLLVQMVGMSIERLATEQLLIFLTRHAPPDLAEMALVLSQLDAHVCPKEVLSQTDSLIALDFTEALFEWAANPEAHPHTASLVSIMVSPPDWAQEVLSAKPAFANVEEFRAALQKSSIDSAWQAEQQRREIYARWEAQPFPQAWRALDQFHKEIAALAAKAPVQLACDSFWEPDRYYYVRAATRTQRNAASVVFAILQYQNQHGRLPASLDDLRQIEFPFDATDPFSGEPLRYRVEGGGQSLTLYGVGPDQQDNGGQHNRFERTAGDFVYWPPRLPERIDSVAGD